MDQDGRNSACREVLNKLLENPDGQLDVNRLKIQSSKRHHLKVLPKNSEILSLASRLEKEKLLPALQIKHVRSISGVNIVSVMSCPRDCPHGRCAYCPNEKDVPSSYTGKEPAAMRGIQNKFDPYLQVRSRLKQLKEIGHSINKIELIIQGGTFPASPTEYQREFIKGCLDAITGESSENLEDAMQKATWSKNRIVGLTVETRPDYATRKDVDNMLSMGVTRVEVGVQNLYDEIYDLVDRGHHVDTVIESFRTLKDSGLKIVAHMMPGLPGSNPEKDLDGFRRLFDDPSFRPDMLKIYPCLVLKGTKLYDWWLEGSYKPYELEQTVELITRVKEMVPPWIRIMRIQRDIPAYLILDGVKKGNLREILLKRMNEKAIKCRCIRCREIGHKLLRHENPPTPDDLRLITRTYEASEGEEIFISIEAPDSECLVGYARLRIPSRKAHRKEIVEKGAALIREIHVLGPLVPIGESDPDVWQHKGYGSSLLGEAEKIAWTKYDCKKILITSAIGSRRYFMKFGYGLEGPYMAKSLSDKSA
ncbi:tRNA uridine(34) 5-carboxymethylaminomethyl modification radical SAM/GNAT enzyme Elp3 [Candidatus Bathyarchaeota archaeon]|nr:tRNA uridine(34) 5-carboxymethylaminomethyl modification radical SAM/GNAT enzyme Elp3 [Candidatus Bathyarchaeota archaeon]